MKPARAVRPVRRGHGRVVPGADTTQRRDLLSHPAATAGQPRALPAKVGGAEVRELLPLELDTRYAWLGCTGVDQGEHRRGVARFVELPSDFPRDITRIAVSSNQIRTAGTERKQVPHIVGRHLFDSRFWSSVAVDPLRLERVDRLIRVDRTDETTVMDDLAVDPADDEEGGSTSAWTDCPDRSIFRSVSV